MERAQNQTFKICLLCCLFWVLPIKLQVIALTFALMNDPSQNKVRTSSL